MGGSITETTQARVRNSPRMNSPSTQAGAWQFFRQEE